MIEENDLKQTNQDQGLVVVAEEGYNQKVTMVSVTLFPFIFETKNSHECFLQSHWNVSKKHLIFFLCEVVILV